MSSTKLYLYKNTLYIMKRNYEVSIILKLKYKSSRLETNIILKIIYQIKTTD